MHLELAFKGKIPIVDFLINSLMLQELHQSGFCSLTLSWRTLGHICFLILQLDFHLNLWKLEFVINNKVRDLLLIFLEHIESSPSDLYFFFLSALS